MTENQILIRLEAIEIALSMQGVLKKDVLNFKETCQYLTISPSYLYKLTSSNQIPHYCPQGKRLMFDRKELDQWCMRNRRESKDATDQAAINYVIKNKRRAS